MENWDGDYNSSIGRFLSEDPSFSFSETFNDYLYSKNEPTGRTDWNGKRSRKEIQKYHEILRQLRAIERLKSELNSAVERRDSWVPQLITRTIKKCNTVLTFFEYGEIKNPFEIDILRARDALASAQNALDVMKKELSSIARNVSAICNGQKDQFGRVKTRNSSFKETTECEASIID
ncbi:MAG: hypothetical protein NXH75_06650 [Halobacteriovoraceae bacterium]|nr:hypothetical protein [Halobacteriovoraceae bacterium]